MTNADNTITLREALDNLYILATNNKNGGWHEGFYEECFDRVVEELDFLRNELEFREANKL